MDIKHISGNLNSDDLYALPNKRQHDDSGKVQEVATDEEEEEDSEEKGNKESIEGIEEKDANKDLPFGWEKHEGRFLIKAISKHNNYNTVIDIIDNDGPYYWHIKSGTIQREPPLWQKNQTQAKELKTPVSCLDQTAQFLAQSVRSPNNPITQFYGSKGDAGSGIINRTQVLSLNSKTNCALNKM